MGGGKKNSSFFKPLDGDNHPVVYLRLMQAKKVWEPTLERGNESKMLFT